MYYKIACIQIGSILPLASSWTRSNSYHRFKFAHVWSNRSNSFFCNNFYAVTGSWNGRTPPGPLVLAYHFYQWWQEEVRHIYNNGDIISITMYQYQASQLSTGRPGPGHWSGDISEITISCWLFIRNWILISVLSHISRL